jgi:thiol:disulfide interchange protein
MKGAVRGSGPLSGFLSLGTPHRQKFLKRLLNAFKGGAVGRFVRGLRWALKCAPCSAYPDR